jgi:histidinol-phosphate/aromatic aminotransferase/cobyric acid decarboxylase-like protein
MSAAPLSVLEAIQVAQARAERLGHGSRRGICAGCGAAELLGRLTVVMRAARALALCPSCAEES